MLKSYLLKIYAGADALNRANILSLSRQVPAPNILLDIGCDDGAWTSHLAQQFQPNQVNGYEIVESRAKLAQAKNINVHICDISQAWPSQSESVDLIHSNQVIEHVPDVDHFTSEMKRILKPGGHIIVSTENGSSWHNIAAAIMGWQIFSLTNVSSLRAGVGNPFSLMRNQSNELKSWTHKTIFNYRGLIEFLELHGFEIVRVLGAGYHPFSPRLGLIDPRHSHFLTVLARKPL